jgi:hypothetical protein
VCCLQLSILSGIDRGATIRRRGCEEIGKNATMAMERGLEEQCLMKTNTRPGNGRAQDQTAVGARVGVRTKVDRVWVRVG